MNNTYLFISLLCIISLNCFYDLYANRNQEGFNLDDLNPVKLVDKGLGKIVDLLLGGIPILKDIYKKVKKKDGLLSKLKTTFYELFISLLTIIFTPIASLVVLFLAYQLFLFMMSNLPLLFRQYSFLKCH